jgi:hypothetical protein
MARWQCALILGWPDMTRYNTSEQSPAGHTSASGLMVSLTSYSRVLMASNAVSARRAGRRPGEGGWVASHNGNNPAGRREARPSRELDMFHDTNMSVGTPGIGGDVPDKLRDERIAVPWRLSAHV